MDSIQMLKDRLPNHGQAIDELAKIGAIDDLTAKVAITKLSLQSYRGRKQDAESRIADVLCVSKSTVRRYERR